MKKKANIKKKKRPTNKTEKSSRREIKRIDNTVAKYIKEFDKMERGLCE